MGEQALSVFVVGGAATRAGVDASLPGAAGTDTLRAAVGEPGCTVVDLDEVGLEVLASLARNPLGPPVVAVAAEPGQALVDAALAAGADDCVPVHDAGRLAHAVRCAVARRRRAGGVHADVQLRLLDAVGQAVIATDPGGCVLFWNAAAQELYGWTAQEAVGRSVLELTPSEASSEQAEEIMTALRAGMSWTGDFPVRRKDGSSFTARVTNRPLLDENGAVIGVIGVSSVTTDRVEVDLGARRTAAAIGRAEGAVITASPDGAVLAWNGGAQSPSGEPRSPGGTVAVAPEHGLERLWELHGEGASLASIAAALNSAGYRTPTGQRWHRKSVGRVLGEPALAARLDP